MNDNTPRHIDNVIMIDYVDKLRHTSDVDNEKLKEWSLRLREAAKGKTLVMYKELKRERM